MDLRLRTRQGLRQVQRRHRAGSPSPQGIETRHHARAPRLASDLAGLLQRLRRVLLRDAPNPREVPFHPRRETGERRSGVPLPNDSDAAIFLARAYSRRPVEEGGGSPDIPCWAVQHAPAVQRPVAAVLAGVGIGQCREPGGGPGAVGGVRAECRGHGGSLCRNSAETAPVTSC